MYRSAGVIKQGIAMKPCSQCKKTKPLSDFDRYPSGTVKAKCKACYADYRRMWRKKKSIKERPDYMPECAQMRHPDRMVMEGNVQKAMKKYAEEGQKIVLAHLSFEADAGLCDIILGRKEE